MRPSRPSTGETTNTDRRLSQNDDEHGNENTSQQSAHYVA